MSWAVKASHIWGTPKSVNSLSGPNFDLPPISTVSYILGSSPLDQNAAINRQCSLTYFKDMVFLAQVVMYDVWLPLFVPCRWVEGRVQGIIDVSQSDLQQNCFTGVITLRNSGSSGKHSGVGIEVRVAIGWRGRTSRLLQWWHIVGWSLHRVLSAAVLGADTGMMVASTLGALAHRATPSTDVVP